MGSLTPNHNTYLISKEQMKLNKLWAMMLLGALALTSCSKESDLTTPEAQPIEAQTPEAPKTKFVHIDLTAGQNDNELRVAFGLNAAGATTGLKMSDKNVILRVAVKRGDGLPVMQDLEFKKTPNRNHATYSGQIEIPADGSGAYQISAILLKEVGGEVYGQEEEQAVLDRDPSFRKAAISIFRMAPAVQSSGSAVEVNMPYLTDWQPLTVTDKIIQPVTLNLRPFGTLLRIKIKNDTDTEATFKDIRFVTNAFGHSVSFDQDRSRGNRPYWVSGNSEFFDIDLTKVGGAVTVPGKQESGWYYAVVFPREVSASVINTTASLRLASGGPFSRAFTTSQPLPHGSLPVTLTYLGGHGATFGTLPEFDAWGTPAATKLAIDYVADYDLKPDGSGFMTTHTTNNAETPLVSLAKMQALPASISIGGANYHVPTRAEMASIFPPRVDLINGIVHNNNMTQNGYIEQDVQIGDTKRDYVSDYRKIGTGETAVMYALRFKYTANCTAYRYTISTLSDDSKAAKVECIYIGLDLDDNIKIADVANETFWTTRASQIKSRTFPFYGESYGPNGAINGLNKYVHLWTKSTHESVSYFMALANGAWGVTALKSETTNAAVRLFHDN